MGKLKKILRKKWNRFLAARSPDASCRLNNIVLKYRNLDVRFGYDAKRKLYFANEEHCTVYFSERFRGFSLYEFGIKNRAYQLAKSYFIDKIGFEPGDVVIDCGANYADLYQYFKLNKKDIRYISFEPAPSEFACIKLNANGMENYNLALSNEIGEFDFYVSSEGANSSLILPKDKHSEINKVQTESLDRFLPNNGIDRVKLLKLEAEGAEPEILKGAASCLSSFDYIAVDGGEERGLSEESTIEALSNHLISNGFDMIELDIRSGCGRALFKNRQLSIT